VGAIVFKPVSSRLDVPALEREQIEVWREGRTMERYLARNEGSERRFSFLDGPITANNPMGVHHAWGRTYKDLYQRYHTMLGERQRYQNGFDCQGLWIEVEAEKELGFKNKRDIEAYGIDRFVEFCKARTRRFADQITEQSIRLGYWMDWDRSDEDWAKPPGERKSYFTMSEENNYTIWAFLAECHRRELIYKGHDVMPWCPRCGTGLSNMELATEGYRELSHLSLTVRLPISTAGHEDEDLLIWTTTPWTLSSNVAAAVQPDLTYVLVRGENGRDWWLSHGSQPRVAPGAAIVREARGAELVGLTYAGPFDELPAAAGVEHPVIPWADVSDEEGTGIVHIAPGSGQEDFALSREFGLAVIDPIDEFGRFRDGFGWQSGRYAGADDPDGADLAREVAEDLDRKGLLVSQEHFRHSYPVCWRCGTQVVFRLVDEWFIAMEPLRAELSDATRRATWLPDGIGLEERELDWLRNMSDWMISKKRYYGLALPIWTCTECDAWEVIASRDDLQQRAVAGWDAFDGHSPHRPWVDAVEIECAACGGRARRILDVGNPWLDAGIVGISTLKWTTDRAYWQEWYPAEFVTESFPGQFRNWFYALISESAVMTGEAPFRKLFGYATARDEQGEEMHKSKGNAILFDDAAEQIGADVMRWMFSTSNPATNMNFGYHLAHEEVRRFFLPLWNSYGFFVTYARLDGWAPDHAGGSAEARTLLDRWVLSRLDGLIGEVRAALDGYDAQRASRSIEAFVDDLSNWYVRRNRRRFWKGELDADKRAAYASLHEVLATVARLLAPFVPHLADAIWGNLVADVDRSAADSVHLTDYPERVPGRAAPEVDSAVALARETVSLGRTARAASGLKTRQPIAAVRVKLPAAANGRFSPDPATASELESEILEELNAKALEVLTDASELVERHLYPLLPVIGPRHGGDVGKVMAAVRSGDWRILDDGSAEAGGVTLAPDEFELTARARSGHEVAEVGDMLVALDTQLTPELEAEGLARDVAHRLQGLRKVAGLEVSDRILASIDGPANVVAQLAPHREWLAAEILATELDLGEAAEPGPSATVEEVPLPEGRLRLAVRRA
jgi:isoleucyl-tRNA synthetase